MTATRCAQCKAPRQADEAICRRCGRSFEGATGRSSGSVLVLRQIAPEPSAETREVRETVQVGRKEGAIRLGDRSVSRRHASISPVGNGFVLQDLGSKNFTFVNARKITAPTPIEDGDRIGFGDVVLVAELRRPAPADKIDVNGTVGYGTVDAQAGGAAHAPLVDVTLPDGPVVVNPPPQSVLEPSPTRRNRADLAGMRALIAEARTIEANPMEPGNIESLHAWVRSAVPLLETQLRLLELLLSEDSDGRA